MSELHDHHPHTFDETIFFWIHRGGYPVLFGLLLLCGVGLPLPEDLPLIAAGFFVQRGEFNLAIAAVCAWCGIIGGDCILYSLGRKFGADVSKIPILGRRLNQKRMKKVERWFAHYGVLVVAVGRMFAGVRGAMVVVAGATKFNFWKFLIADGLAAVVSGGLFIFIGYKFSTHLRWLLDDVVPKIKWGMLGGAIALALVIIAVIWWRKRSRRDQSPGDSPDRVDPMVGEYVPPPN